METRKVIQERESIIGRIREAALKDLIIVLLDKEGNVLKVLGSSNFAGFLGLGSEEKNFSSFFSQIKILGEEDKEEILRSIKEREPREWHIDVCQDEKRWYHFHLFVYPNPEKGIVIFGIRDETELTALKRKLERERIVLQERSKHYLQDLTLLAHEIRSPLVKMGLTARRIIHLIEKEEMPTTEAIAQSLRTIAALAKEAEDLLTNILEAERMSHGKPQLLKEKIDMYEDVVEHVLGSYDTVLALIKKRVVVDHQTSFGRKEALLLADKRLCRILWRNLIANAIAHTPEGGRICYGAVDKGEEIEFNVYNEGTPIPDEIADKIFEKGFRGNSESEGFGLGLFLVKQIVESHGGKIEVEKGRKEGVNIIFSLPKN